MPLTLIVDKSVAYTSSEKSRWIREHGYTDVVSLDNVEYVGTVTLMGDIPAAIINITDSKQVKSINEFLKKKSKSGGLQEWASNGVLMVTNLGRNVTKGLEGTIIKNGGEVVTAKENSKEKSSETLERILSEYNLNPDVENYLRNYCGDEYDKAIPFLTAVGKLSQKLQYHVSVEQAAIRLPFPEGSIPPWEIEKPLFRGTATETVRVLRRVMQDSHPLVILSILIGKISLARNIAASKTGYNHVQLASVASMLGVPNNYPFKLASESADRYGYEKLTCVLKKLYETQAAVKGEIPLPPKEVTEVAILEIYSILHS